MADIDKNWQISQTCSTMKKRWYTIRWSYR